MVGEIAAEIKIEDINCSMSMGYETKTEVGFDVEKVKPIVYNPLEDDTFEIRECYWGDLA